MNFRFFYIYLKINKGDIISNQANDYNKVMQILT